MRAVTGSVTHQSSVCLEAAGGALSLAETRMAFQPAFLPPWAPRSTEQSKQHLKGVQQACGCPS